MSDDPTLPLPATLEPISRPSSTSTTTSLAQLPGISALATGASGGSATSSPQLRATNIPPAPSPVALPVPSLPPPQPPANMQTSPPSTQLTPSGTLPTCNNCQTSTTPLWRRDEMGSVLCNACGLFLKLHGRSRPISLKTDVIKSRNRVKTMRPDMQMKKKQSLPATATAPHDHNGMNMQGHDPNTVAALAAVRRASQQNTNGHGHAADSPVSRTGTPNMYDPHLAAFHPDLNHFPSDSLAQYPLPGGSPRAASPLNGDQQQSGEIPQTHEQLIAANSSLKTRVSELDLINELYRGRLTQLEQDQANADNLRHNADVAAKEAAQERMQREEIQRQLEDSHRRENLFKRRLDEMEQENQELKTKLAELEERPAKRAKVSSIEDTKVAEEKVEQPEEIKADDPKTEEAPSEAAKTEAAQIEATQIEDVAIDTAMDVTEDGKPDEEVKVDDPVVSEPLSAP